MRIGIDIDDTITYTYERLLEKIGTYYKIDHKVLIEAGITYSDIARNKKTFKNYEKFTKEIFEETMYDVPLKENAKDVLEKLHKDGHEIIFITARCKSEYKDPYQYSYDYLKRKNIYFDELYAEITNKGEFCKKNKIDVLIDDSINNCLSAKEYNIKQILFKTSYNKNNIMFKSTDSWLEIYNIINKNML